MYFKRTIDAIGHTPLVDISGMSKNPKVRILAKLEGQNLGGSASIKDRVAKNMLEKAVQSGQLTRDKEIIEATSGNTGIALAWLGNILGYKVNIVMPENVSLERRRLLQIFGARLILTPGSQGMKGAIATAYDMAARNKKYFMPDQFTNLANPQIHYETTAVELIKDFPYAKIDAVVVGIGTGGTIMGVGRRLREKYPGIEIIGVEPIPGDIIQGLKCLEELGEPPPFMDFSIINERAAVTSRQAETATRMALKREGIFVGLSSGAVIHQALKVAEQMEEGNIVAVLADGGWKYLSMEFWTEAER